ncbi:MAG: hypothetical protein NDF53_02690 [archaeon GB-1867-097]|nr:hypothetical protein [Candidatus Culexmicrobium thermophilum]MCS7384621.1 hypothetical protein [Candidatus Culexmicrobium thermophilum]HDO20068.1 hypothetical protein [Candidatus Bathyarchaeota archaeon]
MVDWGAEIILAAISFSLGAFLTYGIMREKMKTKAFEEAQRQALSMVEEIMETERKRIEEELEKKYREKLEGKNS